MFIIDVGNSKVKIALFNKNKIEKKSVFDTRSCFEKQFIRREIFGDVKEDTIAFSSVVPEITREIVSISLELGIRCFDVCEAKDKVLTINYKVEELGSDRLANAVAAYRKYSPPLLVIDFGTATTYNIVLDDGTFDGGIIAPGIKSCIDFLIQNTGLLPEIPLKSPATFLGHNTEEALVSGFYYTFTGQFKEILSLAKKQVGEDIKIIGTGGLVNFAKEKFKQIIVDKDLTLYGIKMLYEANR